MRKNVWTLPAGDATLDWYAVAVAAMQKKAATDPGSWRYQAAIHGLPDKETVPDAADAYWKKCQHASSFFLPWHRMYLLEFERIVAAEVAAAGGPADWALPYWDYSKDAASRLLPEAFRQPKRKDGTPNALFVQLRSAKANAGQPFMEERDVDLTAALDAPGTTDVGGFFGPPPTNHNGGGTLPFGALESAPHNNVHVAVGSDAVVDGKPADGWMLDPDLAAGDPIFWLHHANIDRLWQVWLDRDPEQHANLTSPYWRSGVSFKFHDANGTRVSLKTEQVLDTAGPALGYKYEDTSDPLAHPPAGRRVGGPVGQHELVGATTDAVELGEDVTHVEVPTPVTASAFAAHARTGKVEHVVLRLENVTSAHPAPVYDVYLNVPAPSAPKQHEDRFVGRASMFGIAKATLARGQHGGSGVAFAFDITALYRRLEAAHAIDPQHLRVSFVPVRARNDAKVHVGRVSLYFA
ncbi:MAG TPA: tyrosinase family protein [Polyangiaceae bacterium]|nr:tyrosinase family protein [Polyangiaceae bacterium]